MISGDDIEAMRESDQEKANALLAELRQGYTDKDIFNIVMVFRDHGLLHEDDALVKIASEARKTK